MKDKKEFISEIDYNKSSKGCSPCLSECKKINDRINKRNLSDIKDKEVPHILKAVSYTHLTLPTISDV